jgi:hypothetical protein
MSQLPRFGSNTATQIINYAEDESGYVEGVEGYQARLLVTLVKPEARAKDWTLICRILRHDVNKE